MASDYFLARLSPTGSSLLFPTFLGSSTSGVPHGTPAVAFPITLASAFPGLFTSAQDGKGQAAVVNQDGTVNTPSPAGTYIQVDGTGLGPFSPASADGLHTWRCR